MRARIIGNRRQRASLHPSRRPTLPPMGHGPAADDAVERGRAGPHPGGLGGVVRYKVQADLFATVDRTLAERAHTVIPRSVEPLPLGRGILYHMAVAAEGSAVGS